MIKYLRCSLPGLLASSPGGPGTWSRLITPLLLFLVWAAPVRAQTGVQNITLVNGWNAVWLEVEPTYPDGDPRAGLAQEPADVFPAEVVTVVSPKVLAGLAEFFAAAPTAATAFNQAGWDQWNRPAAIGDDLVAVTGNRPYLIQAAAAVQFTVSGTASFARPLWTPDRFNLVGFGINGSISIQDFFAPSGGAHPVDRIYTLAPDGNWALVDPVNPMGNNVAYWIFSSGPSQYMGPVAVDFDLATLGGLRFGGPGDAVPVGSGTSTTPLDLKDLVFTNLGPSAVTPTLELIVPAAGAGNLALRVVQPAANGLGYVLGNQIDSTPSDGQSTPLGETVAPEGTSVLTLGASRNWTTGAVERTNLYRLTTGNPGTQIWLPVSALNNNIQSPSDILPATDTARVAGLWVGEVIVDGVTSIVETGEPTRPSAGSAPFRLLLHSDAVGAVSLLSQVTIMQTKTADSRIAPDPVLVVEQARIPFFEGIKERNGKRVGLRLQAVTYDMPRKLDATSQAALLADAAFPQLTTAAGIPAFLLSRTTRPPSLADTYDTAWPLEGSLGLGKTVRTGANAPLVLDPFHRSNPFRHAFHQRHARGPQITRRLEIVFDASQPLSDQLRGSYREVLQGVTRTDLELTGRVELSRLSSVDTLDAAP